MGIRAVEEFQEKACPEERGIEAYQKSFPDKTVLPAFLSPKGRRSALVGGLYRAGG